MKRRYLFLIASSLTLSAAAAQQPQTPPQTEPRPKPMPASEPTLDELLGLPVKPAPAPADAPVTDPKPDPNDAVRRALQEDAKPAGFEDIVQLMTSAGSRLSVAADPGLDTQRTQEDVLRKLDKLIAEAKKQQQQKKQKSKSKSKPQDSPSEEQQQQQQSSQAQAQSAAQQTSSGGGPARADGPLNTPLAGGEASWGNLPPHVRDALRQGSSDRFSSLYRALTEEYYKRLAEQPRNSTSRPTDADRQP